MKKVILASIGLLFFSGMSLVYGQAGNGILERSKAVFLNPDTSIVMIAAHRGAHQHAPENSIQSFTDAINLGIDIIELDVRCTKDGQLVVMHDKTVDRTTNGKGEVSKLTLQEIKQLQLTFNGQITKEKVPTLEEALLHTKGKILIDLDIKSVDCAGRIVETVVKTGTTGNCMFFVGEPEHLKMLKQMNKDLMVLARSHSAGEIDSYFATGKPDAIHIDDSHHTKEVIEQIRKYGAKSWTNALGPIDKKVKAGDINAFKEAISNGAGIIQTDYPAELKQFLTGLKKYHQ